MPGRAQLNQAGSWKFAIATAYLIAIIIVLCHHIPRAAAQSPNASPEVPPAASPSPVAQASPSPAPPSPAPSNSPAPPASPSAQPSRAPSSSSPSSPPRATSTPGASPTPSGSRAPSRSPSSPSPTAVVGAIRPSDNGGLSDNAKIGLGVGLGVGVPVLLVALAVTATVVGLLLHRRMHSGASGGNATARRARPTAAAAAAAVTPAPATIVQRSAQPNEPPSAVLYRSRVPAPSASSAETMEIVEQADVEGGGRQQAGAALNSGDLQTSVSTTSFSSASSAGSWRRNNNVDLFVTEEPV